MLEEGKQARYLVGEEGRFHTSTLGKGLFPKTYLASLSRQCVDDCTNSNLPGRYAAENNGATKGH